MYTFYLGCILASPVAASTPTSSESVECTINLNRWDWRADNFRTDCSNIPEIEFISTKRVGNKNKSQAVIAIKLDGTVNLDGYTEAIFDIKYGKKRSGYTVNIGDSKTNNGGKGDAGTQSNDAELDIVDNLMSVYGNDGIDHAVDPEMYKLLTYSLRPGRSSITLRIKDRFVGWTHLRRTGEHRSEYLYALNGQVDTEGPENHTIYAAFNRVVGTAFRSGEGVSKVSITLKRDPVINLVTKNDNWEITGHGGKLTYNLKGDMLCVLLNAKGLTPSLYYQCEVVSKGADGTDWNVLNPTEYNYYYGQANDDGNIHVDFCLDVNDATDIEVNVKNAQWAPLLNPSKYGVLHEWAHTPGQGYDYIYYAESEIADTL
ncbi:MAG: hypothetical protein D3919_04855 [Candidatus Electrothrix sp. AW5]|jgi:hypothetical protein|nr:hypothetical protein [Candidatus Electrothrix gigas]